jgi:hypothetical protein
VVIGKSNGSGANKTEFNLKSLNIGMDRRIAQDKIIGFSLGLEKPLLPWSALGVLFLLTLCVALATPSTASILPLLLSSNAP